MSEFAIDAVHGAATHPGRRRSANEDAYLAVAPLFLVADGMGGHDAGAAASSAVIDAFCALRAGGSISVTTIREAIDRARAEVEQIGGSRAAGTTLTGVAITDVNGIGYWLAVNIGDSRTYRYADGKLDQVTVDHSTVQELIDAGAVTAEEAATHHQRNEITRAIGAGSEATPDFWLFPAEPGDRMLVCSDGLTGELTDAQIAVVLEAESDPAGAATRLVHEALVSGGRDNVTVLVVDAVSVVGADGDEQTSPAVRGIAEQEDDLEGDEDTEDTLPRERVRA